MEHQKPNANANANAIAIAIANEDDEGEVADEETDEDGNRFFYYECSSAIRFESPTPSLYVVTTPSGGSLCGRLFTNRADAMQFLRNKYANAAQASLVYRFKECDNLDEAEAFLKRFYTLGPSQPKKTVAEDVMLRKPTVQQFNRLRSFIQRGDVDMFLQQIKQNLKYVVTEGGTPRCLGDNRYNILHLAAIHNQAKICEALLNTICCTAYWSGWYPQITDEQAREKIDFLADMYINMPDSKNLETPLHIACKFGYVEVSRILLARPECNYMGTNKDNKTAVELVSDHATTHGQSLEEGALIKQEICHLLQRRYYVHLLRYYDNSVSPIIMFPTARLAIDDLFVQNRKSFDDSASRVSPTIMSREDLPQVASRGSDLFSSPINIAQIPPGMVVSAFAGPLTLESAKKLYYEWIAPRGLRPFSESNSLENYELVRMDSAKGLERVGRQLAYSHKSDWHEFWPFLNRFIDLSTPDGHACLDDHLRLYEMHGGKSEFLTRSCQSAGTSRFRFRSEMRLRSSPIKTVFMNGGSVPSRLDYYVFNAITPPHSQRTKVDSVRQRDKDRHSMDFSVFRDTTPSASCDISLSPNLVFLRHWYDTVSMWTEAQWGNVLGQSNSLRGSASVGSITRKQQKPKHKSQLSHLKKKLLDFRLSHSATPHS